MILLFIKSFIIGAIMASPFGAVGLYIANNTIRYGLAFGLLLCVSATLPDVFYAWIAAYSLTMASTFFIDKAFWFELLGGCVAIGMGVYLLTQKPQYIDKKEKKEAVAKNKLIALFVVFGMVALYIKTILITGIAFAMFNLEELLEGGFMGIVLLTCGVAAGSFFSYGSVAYATHRAHGLITEDRLAIIYRISGCVLLLLGAGFLLTATFKHYGMPLL